MYPKSQNEAELLPPFMDYTKFDNEVGHPIAYMQSHSMTSNNMQSLSAIEQHFMIIMAEVCMSTVVLEHMIDTMANNVPNMQLVIKI